MNLTFFLKLIKPSAIFVLFGFCLFFLIRYYEPSDALSCLRYISGTKLDERIIRADLDPGYKDGRQYGRGKSGGQVSFLHHQTTCYGSSSHKPILVLSPPFFLPSHAPACVCVCVCLCEQVRDEYREDYDVGRGGWGHLKQRQEEKERQLQQDAVYRDDHDVGGNRDVPDGVGEMVRSFSHVSKSSRNPCPLPPISFLVRSSA